MYLIFDFKTVCDEFETFVGDGTKHGFREMVRLLFTAFMECADDTAKSQVSALVGRLLEDSPSHVTNDVKSLNKRKTRENSICYEESGVNADDTSMRALILHLHKDYPGDLGSLCPLLLNCLYLTEGEAFFMGSNEPHAYISG